MSVLVNNWLSDRNNPSLGQYFDNSRPLGSETRVTDEI